ncbi:MAG: hypothetical protein JOZ81_29740 [Chloroflexi bacterium]|nr:hypothetical protein [Chloroflexota bacterium]
MDSLRATPARPALGRLACERPLRTAAATLADSGGREIRSTTVVAAVGADDLDLLHKLVNTIASEFGIRAVVRAYAGSCAVRFSWPLI